MKSSNSTHKKQPEKSYFFRYSKDFEAMVLEIHDIEGMLPLFVKVPKLPSLGIRKISLVNKKDGLPGLQMT